MTRTILLLCLFSLPALGERLIELETKKVDGATHWVPSTIEVKQGEKIKIVAKHTMKGGFDFHGLFIPALKVAKQVNRNQAATVEVTVPGKLKPGKYRVGCHFHSTHRPATLVVKPN